MLTCNEVSGDVRATIRNQKLQAEQQKVFEELRARADVKILDPEIFPSAQATAPASADVTAPPAETQSADQAAPAPGHPH